MWPLSRALSHENDSYYTMALVLAELPSSEIIDTRAHDAYASWDYYLRAAYILFRAFNYVATKLMAASIRRNTMFHLGAMCQHRKLGHGTKS